MYEIIERGTYKRKRDKARDKKITKRESEDSVFFSPAVAFHHTLRLYDVKKKKQGATVYVSCALRCERSET